MRQFRIVRSTGFDVNNGVEGESIETKIERITENKEPIGDSAPIIYTERKDGVLPEYNIRTDRFELAIDAMDKVSGTHLAKRVELHKGNDESDSLEQSSDNTSDESK